MLGLSYSHLILFRLLAKNQFQAFLLSCGLCYSLICPFISLFSLQQYTCSQLSVTFHRELNSVTFFITTFKACHHLALDSWISWTSKISKQNLGTNIQLLIIFLLPSKVIKKIPPSTNTTISFIKGHFGIKKL